jgi:putative acetyltransferase
VISGKLPRMAGVRGVLIEGIPCAGKSTLLRGLLSHPSFVHRAGLSTLVLTEHHTLRVLEPRRGSLGVADNVGLLRGHVDYIAALTARLAAMPHWRGRPNPALTVVLERFHLSHVVSHQHLRWEDVAALDAELADVGVRLCLLLVTPAELRRRLLGDRGARWASFLAEEGVRDRLVDASDVDAQVDYFLRQQDALRTLSARSRMPVEEIDASIDPEGAVRRVLAQVSEAEVRRAGRDDMDLIAAVHRESILTLGPGAYTAEVVEEWGAPRTGDPYTAALDRGEQFFMASLAGEVVGFSSYRVEGGAHRTAVYVAARAARRGVGTALFRAAEAAAIASGAPALEVSASLLAVDFYRANGFEESGRGQHPLRSGQTMPCVFMRKRLSVK